MNELIKVSNEINVDKNFFNKASNQSKHRVIQLLFRSLLLSRCFFFQLEMKTSKGHVLTKYVVLYSFILVTVVLSTIIANHVSTKSLMDSIPNQINQNIWTIPEWSILENLSSIQAEIKHALQIGN